MEAVRVLRADARPFVHASESMQRADHSACSGARTGPEFMHRENKTC